ncbi:MAG: hypothetical protein A2Z35_05955 [Actinobacteria bacterium RBG_19FT_COMBO_36_27]|nr:MAG: hypothetical protein A2Z35_05955 [Actinobacteria bacterium RBG_19FT_COMBO_36_27]
MDKKLKSNEEREAFLEEKFEQIQEEQEAGLLLDFDKAIEEKQAKPFTIKILGKFYNIPKQMPFKFATFFFRHCYKKVNGKLTVDVPEEKLFLFIQLMFGNEMLVALEHSNVSVEDVFDTLALEILSKWGYDIKGKKGNAANTEKKT